MLAKHKSIGDNLTLLLKHDGVPASGIAISPARTKTLKTLSGIFKRSPTQSKHPKLRRVRSSGGVLTTSSPTQRQMQTDEISKYIGKHSNKIHKEWKKKGKKEKKVENKRSKAVKCQQEALSNQEKEDLDNEHVEYLIQDALKLEKQEYNNILDLSLPLESIPKVINILTELFLLLTLFPTFTGAE